MKKLFIVLLLLAFSVNGFCAQWDKDVPAATDAKINWPAAAQANGDALDRTLQSYRSGMRMNYSSATTISVSAGQVWVSNAAGTIRLALSNSAATNVTFTNLDTGSEAASTTYYLYAIAAAADSESATFKISASSTAPTGVTYYKRLGSFYNNSSSNITLIDNDSEEWEFGTPVSKSEDTAYQALTDGWVVAMLVMSADDTGTSVIIYSDSSSAPTTVVSAQSLGGAASVDPGGYMTAVYPVKAGDYYKVAMGNNAATSTIYFIPKQ